MEVRRESTLHYKEVPVAGPGFSGVVSLPPLGTSANVTTNFLAAVEKEMPTWKKEIEAARKQQQKVRHFRESRHSAGKARQKQREVHTQQHPLQ